MYRIDMKLADGCCYLRLFIAYNNSFDERAFDLDEIVCRFGKYPLVREVIGCLYARCESDFFIPHIRAVGPSLYHVFPYEDPVKFSDVVEALMFSEARVGGMYEDDNAVCVNQNVAAFSKL